MKKKIVLGVSTAAAVLLVVAALLFINSNHSAGKAVSQNITIGSVAPDYSFLLSNGSYTNLSAYRGHAVVVWFVATWCSTCAQGNELLNQQQSYQFFKQHGVKIIELEMYRDLGYSGPSIASFVGSYAPSAYSNGTIVPGLAGYNMTAAYNPKGYLDIYYLISANGTVMYINGEPSSTLGQLEGAINSSL
ncbi:MAG: redoxin family protein [Candidatus Marsarchaeota archaeon]|jgi:thiol-disulfide isomerase/thioredoxin|nr:redoxin family protein [Candidatus Marsarchaeota archaeon]MCL5111762.1 redoxin family protein [Candidatus Marsarchaeota archaeon]